MAIAFAREGADVLISYLPEEEEDAAGRPRSWIEEAGRKAVLRARRHPRRGALPGDRRPTAVTELGGLDILVNNAAYQMAQPGGIGDITDEQFDRVMKTNLYAMFWLCRAAVPHLRPGATIINTASVQAYQSSSAAAGLRHDQGRHRGLHQGAGRGTRPRRASGSTRWRPGPIWTPLIPATMPEEKVESFGADTPLGRAGQPAELAPAYVYFASQESSYITGEVLGVTGGKPVS